MNQPPLEYAPQGPPPLPGPPPPQGPPPPPQGPGVTPPFPAPPTEGRRSRLGWGLGLGGLVLVLVCGGGFAAAVGLTTLMTRAITEQAQVVVGDYLSDLRDRRWAAAYASLCDRTRSSLTQAEFTSQQAAGEQIRSFDVGTVDLASVNLAVPVDVTYTDGSTDQLQAYLDQNRQTGGFEVCSLEE